MHHLLQWGGGVGVGSIESANDAAAAIENAVDDDSFGATYAATQVCGHVGRAADALSMLGVVGRAVLAVFRIIVIIVIAITIIINIVVVIIVTLA